MSDPSVQEGGKVMSENEGYYCVYYPDLECPVQRKLKELSLIDSIEPLKTDARAEIAKTMKNVMTGSTFFLQVLATFCGSCPHLRRKTYEVAASSGNLVSIGRPKKAVPLPKEEK